MPTKLGVLKGGKISSTHSTVIRAAEKIVIYAKRLPEVSKVVLSVIHHVGSGKVRLKISDIPNGLKMVVRGQSDQQDFYIYTQTPSLVRQAVEGRWRQEQS